jgi:hypothetical protein
MVKNIVFVSHAPIIMGAIILRFIIKKKLADWPEGVWSK